ncbi:MAG: shikimate kinase [Jatrophihabitans sp.]
MPPRAVLIGLPGAGKSTVGARLARRMSLPFADSDQLVVAAAGRSVAAIFATDGEPAFRAIEAGVVLAALAGFDGILALGGGAVTTAQIRQALVAGPAPVVLLQADQAELLRRIGTGRSRPLLADDPAGRLAELTAARSALYQQLASVQVQTAGHSATAVARLVYQQLRNSQRSVS